MAADCLPEDMGDLHTRFRRAISPLGTSPAFLPFCLSHAGVPRVQERKDLPLPLQAHNLAARPVAEGDNASGSAATPSTEACLGVLGVYITANHWELLNMRATEKRRREAGAKHGLRQKAVASSISPVNTAEGGIPKRRRKVMLASASLPLAPAPTLVAGRAALSVSYL